MAVQVDVGYHHFGGGYYSAWCCVHNEISVDGCCWASEERPPGLSDEPRIQRKRSSGALESLFDDVKRMKFASIDPERELQTEAWECRRRQLEKQTSLKANFVPFAHAHSSQSDTADEWGWFDDTHTERKPLEILANWSQHMDDQDQQHRRSFASVTSEDLLME